MTRIAEAFGGGHPTLSLEFFPPKDEEGEARLYAALDDLEVLQPTFASVTYGALGSTRDRTMEIVLRCNQERPFPTMAHLTCVGHTKDDVVDLLDAYAAGGVDNILALGGDPPEDGSAPGDFEHAIELVELCRDHPHDFSVGVAAQPEKHPRSPSFESDRRFLAEKLELADFAVTQFFWEAEPYRRLLHELADLGCEKPVVPGVMLFINVHSMHRMSSMNDTAVPDWLWERCEAVDGDPKAVRLLGTDLAEDLCGELLELGAPGLHLYTLNRSAAALDVVQRLGITPATA